MAKNNNSKQTTCDIKQEDLEQAYLSATKVLIPLTDELRRSSQEKRTHDDMITAFSSCGKDWHQLKTKSGHVEFKNIVTGVVIGFSGHKKDGTLNNQEKSQHLGLIQEHLNILCNIIFAYDHENWKSKPNYPTALNNYAFWKSKGKPREEIKKGVETTLGCVNLKARK